MIYILLPLLLLNTSMLFSTLLNKKIGETLFHSIISIIFILFMFGLFNGLYIGIITIIILNIFALLYNIYCIKNKKVDLKNNIIKGGLLFIISYTIIVWSAVGREACKWDEFSHWALAVKNMFELNNLGLGSDSTIIFKTYLSGTSIFQYFCVALAGEYNESLLYVAMNLIILSFIIPAFESFNKISKFIKTLLYIVMLFLPTIFYPTLYTSLYVDGVLALCFAYTIYSYFCNRKKELTKFDIINLISCFMMLIFTKDFGLVLSLLALVIILIDNIFVVNKFEFKIKALIKNNYKIVLTIIPALLVKLFWIIKLSILKISTAGQGVGILNTLTEIIKLNFQEYQKEVIMIYTKALGTTNLANANYTISYITIIALIFLIGYLIYTNVKKENKKRTMMYTTTTIICAIVYAGLLLLCYISIFSEYEAVRLASYDRYINSFALGGLFAFIVLLMNSVKDKKQKFEKYTITIFIIFIIIIDFKTLVLFISGPAYNTSKGIRDNYNEFENKITRNLEKNDKLYFISTNDDGFDYYVARYEITPIVMKDVWSIGYPYSEGDIWTKYIEIDQLRDELIKKYDYVYLYDIDEPFIELYGSLFIDDNIKDNQLYEINKDSSGPILSFVE